MLQKKNQTKEHQRAPLTPFLILDGELLLCKGGNLYLNPRIFRIYNPPSLIKIRKGVKTAPAGWLVSFFSFSTFYQTLLHSSESILSLILINSSRLRESHFLTASSNKDEYDSFLRCLSHLNSGLSE